MRTSCCRPCCWPKRTATAANWRQTVTSSYCKGCATRRKTWPRSWPSRARTRRERGRRPPSAVRAATKPTSWPWRCSARCCDCRATRWRLSPRRSSAPRCSLTSSAISPAVVCIGSLPPGGVAQTRYLCKRIRQQAPNVKIVVGRWGDGGNTERMEKRLRGAGADQLSTSLHDSREQIIPLLQVATNVTSSAETSAPQLVTSR